jgi:hypothetical protein
MKISIIKNYSIAKIANNKFHYFLIYKINLLSIKDLLSDNKKELKKLNKS